MAVTKAQLKKIALSFPLAAEATSYGKPAFQVGKKFFTRLRDEDNSLVLILDSIDEREMLMEVDPKTFFITDHYKDYPSVLVRLERIDTDTLRGMLDRRWRKIAPKKLVKDVEGAAAGTPAKSTAKKKPAKRKLAKKKR
jgi:hypothetical protein